MADRAHRFSSWDGTQEPLGPDADSVFDRLSEDVFHGWDFETALRRLLNSGWREPGEDRRPGMEELMERLRRRREQQLRRFNLDSVFKDITERLDRVISQERRGIEERLDAAGPDESGSLLERIAAERRRTLDELSPDPGAAIKQLRDYEFMDRRAERQIAELLEEIRKGVVDGYFRQMSQSMQAMSKEDLAHLREMVRDLNALLRQKLEGVPEAQLQRNYEAFLRRWGQLFPDAPETFAEFLEQLMRQMARMESLMQSLSPEMRRELQSVMESVFDDPELQATLAELAGSLDLISPRQQLGSSYGFFGDQEVSLEEAMRLMDGLQTLEEAERGLRGMQRGERLDESLRQQLEDVLGRDAARSVEQMERILGELEDRGLLERGDAGLQLTARGMRRIGQKALGDLFARLRRDRFGEHSLARQGHGGEHAEESKPYEFGDVFDLDVQGTVMNAIRRESGIARPGGA